MMDSKINEAMLRIHSGRRALQLARAMQEKAYDEIGLIDDTITAIARELQEAEADAARLIGPDGVETAAGTIYCVPEDRRSRRRVRFMLARRKADALRVAS